ncbi:hypothetical protein Vadar_000047 [Vaccinium darrowii]|uniref:Uncharacterized protein n=1 Tax=Vaccinium darrowii TaxID=229202 RepID=A0ACB7X6C1_9ERIC|nr:hypothetical protein Vadar_000047 [Vaccinium darrowii]
MRWKNDTIWYHSFASFDKSMIPQATFVALATSEVNLLLGNLQKRSTESASPNKIPRLRVLHETFSRGTSKTISAFVPEDYETFFYPQTLDHFNYQPESYATFRQRYVINSKYWGGANESAPIFVYLGDEAPLDGQPEGIGFLLDNAPHFKALLVYIEHRFYGKSIPFGTMQDAMNNASTRGYFNSAQALADCAELVVYLKKKLSAHYSPVIVIGGSYGGMLASWFRLKYPHVALGALASSAPILYFDNITPQDGYFSVVQKDFKEASNNCYETIRKSWSEIDRVASEPNGLSILSQKFETCNPLSNSEEIKEYLIRIYARAAQYDMPPLYPVTQVCGGIDGAKEGTDILGKIFAGLVAFIGNQTCYINSDIDNTPSETDIGWSWQACSEMVIPIGIGIKDTMFQPDPFNLELYSLGCRNAYGVPPRPHWVTTYYGGHDIKLVLRRFGSNIIFSNGLRDPYSSGGVLEDLSDTLLAVHTAQASPTKIPRLRVLHETFSRGTSQTISAFVPGDYETFFYPQTLDHLNYQPESYATFRQSYVINSKYWGGANESAPIFVYLGDEEPLDGQLAVAGFLVFNAPHFKALLVYIEHRFYGQPIPFGTMEDAMNNASTRGYFNSAQALADCAELVIYLKEKLSAHNSPVIVVGGSYGGSHGPPQYPVTQICGGIDGAKEGTDILGKIFAGLVAFTPNPTCYVNQINNSPSESNTSSDGWSWQDIKLVLRRFGSNIIFSNGLRDPYSSGGVLEDLSDTLLAVYTAQGSHCLDILMATETYPQRLIKQKKVEVKIVEGWLKKYYADLHALA